MENRIELHGPEFIQSAVEIAQKMSVQTISRLYVYNLTNDSVSALQTALSNLRNYFAVNGAVIVSTPQVLSADVKAGLQAAAGVPVTVSSPIYQGSGVFQGLGAIQANMAAMQQMQQSDSLQAQTVSTQTAAEARKQQTQRWQIMQDTQTKIFQIQQDTAVNKARMADRISGLFSSHLRS